MKLYALPLLLLFLTFGCSNSDDVVEIQNLPAQTLLNVSYGTDSEQIADIYLPANRTSATKTIILIHGGGWSGGSKADFTAILPEAQAEFPNYAIVNMDYRLGTPQSPGFPKQIQDIETLIAHLKSSSYQISNKYAMIGASAGAHLSMLYAYRYDPQHEVKAVVSIVGPTDFTDPNFVGNPLFTDGLAPLVGNTTFQENPEIYAVVSPVTHVNAQSPPTAMFFGNADPLIPNSQGPILKQKLDQFGVFNEMTYYDGGHGNWDEPSLVNFQQKVIAFITSKF